MPHKGKNEEKMFNHILKIRPINLYIRLSINAKPLTRFLRCCTLSSFEDMGRNKAMFLNFVRISSNSPSASPEITKLINYSQTLQPGFLFGFSRSCGKVSLCVCGIFSESAFYLLHDGFHFV